MTAVRATLLAAAVSFAMILPAAAQQAASGSTESQPAATPPAAEQPAAPAAEAPKTETAPAETATADAAPAAGIKAPDLQAMVQRLRRDLESLTESARQGAQDFLTRQQPYVITTDQLAAIAGGAVVGAIAVDLLGGGGLATLAGAAAGGVAGHWLYENPEQLKMPEIPSLPAMRGQQGG